MPCNDFGKQEPWQESKILETYQKQYGVTFPLSSKVRVLGPDAHPLYAAVRKEVGDEFSPQWNFHKLLIDSKSEVAGIFSHAMSPLETDVTEAIEQALAAQDSPETETQQEPTQ